MARELIESRTHDVMPLKLQLLGANRRAKRAARQDRFALARHYIRDHRVRSVTDHLRMKRKS